MMSFISYFSFLKPSATLRPFLLGNAENVSISVGTFNRAAEAINAKYSNTEKPSDAELERTISEGIKNKFTFMRLVAGFLEKVCKCPDLNESYRKSDNAKAELLKPLFKKLMNITQTTDRIYTEVKNPAQEPRYLHAYNYGGETCLSVGKSSVRQNDDIELGVVWSEPLQDIKNMALQDETQNTPRKNSVSDETRRPYDPSRPNSSSSHTRDFHGAGVSGKFTVGKNGAQVTIK